MGSALLLASIWASNMQKLLKLHNLCVVLWLQLCKNSLNMKHAKYGKFRRNILLPLGECLYGDMVSSI